VTTIKDTTVTLTAAQAVVIARALADAEQYRRDRGMAWCADCAASPAAACPGHLDELDRADAYRDTAAGLARILPELPEGRS
jgi:hypothetical protein